MRLESIAAIAAALLLSGCSDTPLSVTNHSAIELREVEVIGAGFVQRFERIAPGQTVDADVEPLGESNISVQFKAGNRIVAQGADIYFEGGGNWEVAVEVRPDLSTKADSKITGMPVTEAIFRWIGLIR